MKLSSLTAISPIDGRYSNKVNMLRNLFSEFGLLKFRVQIEIRWLQKLSSQDKIKEVPIFDTQINNYLNQIITQFSEEDAIHIKNIENITNHDVKAVEYFLKEKLANIPTLSSISEFIHFACTSEDINNLSYALILSITRHEALLPYWYKIINTIKEIAIKYRNIPLLSRTHGQPATPSTVGKEMINVVFRMKRQYQQLQQIAILGKINGTVGNYNAHVFAYPEIDWHRVSEEFVTSLGIKWNPYTTQIEPHDYISEMLHCIIRFNTILIDFNRDIWGYIALNYFKQKAPIKEIGSSVMPHKINPIDFENSEGNLGLSNSILEYIARKLPISRWQRDLTDSTLLRNLGVGIGHSLIAYQAILKGIDRLEINYESLLKDLNDNFIILAEPIQTIMRKYNIEKPYEKLKELIRNNEYLNIENIKSFIDNLELPEKEKNRLRALTPEDYIGLAVTLVDKF